MKYLISLMFLIIHSNLSAQTQTIDLMLAHSETQGIPFYFNKVNFANTPNGLIGIAEVREQHKMIEFSFPADKENHVLNFLNKNYNGPKTGTPIALNILQLEIVPTHTGQTLPTDTFKFNCSFAANFGNGDETLYTFNAKNTMGLFENPKNILENYIARAIQMAVKKFSSEFKQHKDWNIQPKGTMAQIQVTCNHNKITNKLDSIACEKNFKLNETCYSLNLKEDAKGVQTRFMLTYKAETIESNNKIKLNIETFSFLAKNRSWIAANEKNKEAGFKQQQAHYDICTYYGLKLNKALREYPYTIGEYKTEMNKIYNEIYNEYLKMRKDYEDETKNNPAKIVSWQQKIENLMKQPL
jgi:hypothetical protein